MYVCTIILYNNHENECNMNQRLNDILTTINGFYHYGDDMVHQHISLIKEAIEIIGTIEAPPASILEDAKSNALYELSNELASRLDESFFNASPERRKNEFKISKVLTGVAIGNVLANMQG